MWPFAELLWTLVVIMTTAAGICSYKTVVELSKPQPQLPILLNHTKIQ